jgi:hypothetical protein
MATTKRRAISLLPSGTSLGFLKDLRRVLANTEDLVLNAILNLRIRFRSEPWEKRHGRKKIGRKWSWVCF